MTNRTTKKDIFLALRSMVENVETVCEYPADEVLEFIDKQIEQINAKAESAKAAAAKKKAEGDELRSIVKSFLTDEFQTADAITVQIDDNDVTKSKVVARLGQLVKIGEVIKEQIKDEESGRKIMHYRLVG